MSKKGAFICIEGLDASGKTTHARRLVRDLKQRGFKAMYTTEPSPSEIGKFIRTYILQRKERVPSAVEALLFAVDRVVHLEQRVKPALQKGIIIISDRYVYSSLAYQGAAGLDLNWIEEINRSAVSPDLAIYINVAPEILIKRMKWRKKSVMEQLQIQRKVQQVYLKLVNDGRLVRVDGNRSINEVARDILTLVLDFLKNQN
jgi:dTMP kinase